MLWVLWHIFRCATLTGAKNTKLCHFVFALNVKACTPYPQSSKQFTNNNHKHSNEEKKKRLRNKKRKDLGNKKDKIK